MTEQHKIILIALAAVVAGIIIVGILAWRFLRLPDNPPAARPSTDPAELYREENGYGEGCFDVPAVPAADPAVAATREIRAQDGAPALYRPDDDRGGAAERDSGLPRDEPAGETADQADDAWVAELAAAAAPETPGEALGRLTSAVSTAQAALDAWYANDANWQWCCARILDDAIAVEQYLAAGCPPGPVAWAACDVA